MTPMMRHVSAELIDLADVLATIPVEDWDRPSACDGMRVRDVAAHLALVLLPFSRRHLRTLMHTPAGIARLGGEWSVEHADAHAPDELVALLRRRAAAPRRGFLGRVDPTVNMLADHATHLQDVRVGLGLRATPDRERARAVLDAAVRVWRPVTWGTRERARGLRLVAPDVDWSHGAGPEVRAPYDALLLTLSGRSRCLDELSGDGAELLADRVPVPA